MSTTYYVRTYNCSFPTRNSDCTSRNQVLNFIVTSSSLQFSTNFFSTFSGFYGFYLHYKATGTPTFLLYKPNATTYDNECYSKITATTFKSDIFSTENFINLESAKWDLQGWTTSNIATFKNQICNLINNNKENSGYGGGTNRFGEDNSEVNMILFVCTFDDDPGKTYYFPIFYHGNDPQADETIVI